VREVATGFDENCSETDTIMANAARRVVTAHSSPGAKMARIESRQGFVAEAAASSAMFVPSRFGVPLPTTHNITVCIFGVGASKRLADIRRGVSKRIVLAWMVTFPLCGALHFGQPKSPFAGIRHAESRRLSLAVDTSYALA
jgi:hypothetical protein